MLEHAHGRDAVKCPVVHVAVVLEPYLDLSLQPAGCDPVAGRLRLRRAERHADHLSAVVPRGMDGQAAPPAADIEHPLSGPLGEPELATDQFVLRVLSRFQRVCVLGEARTGVRHGASEDHGVKFVAHVVVVSHRLRITGS